MNRRIESIDRIFMITKIFYTLLPIIITFSILALALYSYNANKISTPNPDYKKEQLARLTELTTLPANETPKIEILSDTETLKSKREFFKDAEDGDILFTYTSSSKAYIYSPINNLIVNEGPADTESRNEKASRLIHERKADYEKIPNSPFRFEGFPASYEEYTPVPVNLEGFEIVENPNYWNDWKSIYTINNLSQDERGAGQETRHFAGDYIFVTHGNGTILNTSLVNGKTGEISAGLPSVVGGTQYYLRPNSRLLVEETSNYSLDDATVPRELSYYFLNENLDFIALGHYKYINGVFTLTEYPESPEVYTLD